MATSQNLNLCECYKHYMFFAFFFQAPGLHWCGIYVDWNCLHSCRGLPLCYLVSDVAANRRNEAASDGKSYRKQCHMVTDYACYIDHL